MDRHLHLTFLNIFANFHYQDDKYRPGAHSASGWKGIRFSRTCLEKIIPCSYSD